MGPWAEFGCVRQADIGQFLATLQKFDRDNFLIENKAMVRTLTGPPSNPDPTFSYEIMKSKSLAAANLCDWVVNICSYHDIFLDVEPKRRKLAESEVKLMDANRKLQVVRDKVAVLEDRKRTLQDQLVAATDEKNRLLEAAANTAKRLNLAERLVNGLKDENERWGAGVESLKEQKLLLVGDVMVSPPPCPHLSHPSRQEASAPPRPSSRATAEASAVSRPLPD